MQSRSNQSGYIAILLILLGTAGALFFFSKMYFTSIKTQDQKGAPVTQYGSLLGDIGAAKAVVNQTEASEAQTNRVLNSLK